MLGGPENGLDMWRMADEWPDWFVHDVQLIMASIAHESTRERKAKAIRDRNKARSNKLKRKRIGRRR